jgi:hypothetical protein
MSSFGRRLAVLAAVLPLALIALAIETGNIDLCSPAEAAGPLKPGDPAACFIEFWLNRYQTMISAFVALFAAFVAANPSWRQLAVLTGDVPPDFWVDWSLEPGSGEGQLENALLKVLNRNRRAMRIRRIRLVEPLEIPIWIFEPAPGLHRHDERRQIPGTNADPGTGPRTWNIDYHVPGRDAGGSDRPEATLIVMFGDEADRTRAGQSERVRFEIEYDLHGSSVERHRTEVSGFVRRRG